MDKLYKFWEWMEKKEYGIIFLNKENHYVILKNIEIGKETKQIFIGFMIEYLIERDGSLELKIDEVDIFILYEKLVNKIAGVYDPSEGK